MHTTFVHCKIVQKGTFSKNYPIWATYFGRISAGDNVFIMHICPFVMKQYSCSKGSAISSWEGGNGISQDNSTSGSSGLGMHWQILSHFICVSLSSDLSIRDQTSWEGGGGFPKTIQPVAVQDWECIGKYCDGLVTSFCAAANLEVIQKFSK